MVAAVARLEPLTAPNPAHPAIVASASPPRRCPTRQAAAPKKSRLAPAAKQKCAMSRNNGNTPSSKRVTDSKNTTLALISAGSGPISSASPTSPTSPIAMPIGTPSASSASNATTPNGPLTIFSPA